MRIKIGRWYFVCVLKLPGKPPACFGFGFPGYEAVARNVASTFAQELIR